MNKLMLQSPVFSRISNENEQLIAAMEPAARDLPALARLGFALQYQEEIFMNLWRGRWGRDADLELEILKVQLREAYFLKAAIRQHKADWKKYLTDLTHLDRMVAQEARGNRSVGWGGNIVYNMLRNRYPEEWCWLLHTHGHAKANELEEEWLARKAAKEQSRATTFNFLSENNAMRQRVMLQLTMG